MEPNEIIARMMCKQQCDNPDRMVPYEELSDGLLTRREQPNPIYSEHRYAEMPLWEFKYGSLGERITTALAEHGYRIQKAASGVKDA